MAKLSEFRTDTRAINDGVWVRVHEGTYGDLEILTRGFTDDFVDAQNARVAKAAEQHAGDAKRVPNAEMRQVNASLLQDYLIIDVRNLVDDDGNPVPVAEFHFMLHQPEYNRLARAAWDAALKVTNRSAAQEAKAKGNSVAHSEPTSIGLTSGTA